MRMSAERGRIFSNGSLNGDAKPFSQHSRFSEDCHRSQHPSSSSSTSISPSPSSSSASIISYQIFEPELTSLASSSFGNLKEEKEMSKS